MGCGGLCYWSRDQDEPTGGIQSTQHQETYWLASHRLLKESRKRQGVSNNRLCERKVVHHVICK